MQLRSSDFDLDDKVTHATDFKVGVGVVVFHNHERDLVRVQWPSGVREWITPPELRKITNEDQGE